MKGTDQEILDTLMEAKRNGATGAILTAEAHKQLEVQIASMAVSTPNRSQRRLVRRMRTSALTFIPTDPTAAKRRKVRRQIANRSRNRNR